MIKFILFLIAFFGLILFYKAVKLILTVKKFQNKNHNKDRVDNSKYSNVQDVEYTEIKDKNDEKHLN